MKISISNTTSGTNTKSDTALPVKIHSYDVDAYSGGYGQGAVNKITISALDTHKADATSATGTTYIDPTGLDENGRGRVYAWSEYKDDIGVGGDVGTAAGYSSPSHKVAFDVISKQAAEFDYLARPGVEAGYNGEGWTCIDSENPYDLMASDKLPAVGKTLKLVAIDAKYGASNKFNNEKVNVNGVFYDTVATGYRTIQVPRSEQIVIKLAPQTAGKTITPGTGASVSTICGTAVDATWWSNISETISEVTYTKKLTIPAGTISDNAYGMIAICVTEV